jgi:hypothetical protein
MKTTFNFQISILAAAVALMFLGLPKASAQVNVSVSFQTFYDELSPYGYWMNTPEYGYVWQPNVASDFQPYATNGYWVMTEYGNTWVSDYDWGWAPFHYGRWYYDNYYGWLWMPDTEWGPAWVSWRTGGGYYGWAPMGPRVYEVPANYWVFVPNRYITHRHFHSYCIPRTRVVNVYHNTTIINNYYTYNNHRYVSGPSVREIERHTGGRVQVHQVRNETRPGRAVVNNGAVRVYRPNVATRDNSSPARINSGPRREMGMSERSRENTSPERGGREGLNNSGRIDNQLRESRRASSESPSRSYDRENPTRTDRERMDRGRMESNRSESSGRFPSRSENREPAFRRNETVQPQPNREQPNRDFNNENRQPSFDRGMRGSGGSNPNPTNDFRSGSPREQRQANPEFTPQRRQESMEAPQPQQRGFSQPEQRQRQERIESPRSRESIQPSGRQSPPAAPSQRPERQSGGASHRQGVNPR